MSNTNTLSNKLEEYLPVLLSSMPEIVELDIGCKSILEKYLTHVNLLGTSAVVKIQAVLDYMHERVNIGNWKEVPIYLRKTITLASFLRVLAHLKSYSYVNNQIIKTSFEIIDFGILFGCPLTEEPMLLQKCASIITSTYRTKIESNDNTTKKTEPLNLCEEFHIQQYNYKKLNTISCPSMENFYTNYILTKQPIILENCIQHWPALIKWQDPSYFIKIAGPRTVSIELGKQYTNSNWTQKLMTIEDFIKGYVYETNGPVGYLAQYQLFQQIPELKDDIIEPEYCCFCDTDDPVDIMAWFGPKGTVSPLHHDPKKNLLTQVVGQKQIFLISPEDSQFVYPYEHEMLNNTAKVDPRKPDFDKYPDFKKANVYYCLLKEGQMLYIPPKWWHFVESLSVSFSVSFWWE